METLQNLYYELRIKTVGIRTKIWYILNYRTLRASRQNYANFNAVCDAYDALCEKQGIKPKTFKAFGWTRYYPE
jgi:hypothetical protein